MKTSRTPRLRRGAASVAIAAAGLVAALGIFLLGRRTSPDDVRAAAADLEALIRENAAGVQARADTLAQLPRLGWAVATDENTMRDLTTEELAFRTHAGEHIEITQMQRGGGEPRRLLRLPTESDVTLPVLTGTHIVVLADQLHVVTVVNVEPRERANELVGILAVAKQVDTSSIERRLAARGISAQLRTIQGSITLAGSAPAVSAIDAKIALTGPAAEGAELVAANVGRARWPSVVSLLVLVLSLVAAGLVRRRGGDGHAESDLTPVAAAGTVDAPPARATASGLGTVPAAATPVAGIPTKLPPPFGTRTPISVPTVPPLAVPEVRRERAHTGRVDISLARSGSVSLSGAAPGARPGPADPAAASDPRTDEYRGLFAEFVKLRRTTGEPVDGLDVSLFVATLREKRAEIMRQIPVKDVRFKLAFQNGKAAIRYMTVG